MRADAVEGVTSADFPLARNGIQRHRALSHRSSVPPIDAGRVGIEDAGIGKRYGSEYDRPTFINIQNIRLYIQNYPPLSLSSILNFIYHKARFCQV